MSALDLGCGTGLVAKSLQSCVEYMDSVYLSFPMIKKTESIHGFNIFMRMKELLKFT